MTVPETPAQERGDLRARLAAIGIPEERLDAAVLELSARVAIINAVPDDQLAGVAPALRFELLPGTPDE